MFRLTLDLTKHPIIQDMIVTISEKSNLSVFDAIKSAITTSTRDKALADADVTEIAIGQWQHANWNDAFQYKKLSSPIIQVVLTEEQIDILDDIIVGAFFGWSSDRVEYICDQVPSDNCVGVGEECEKCEPYSIPDFDVNNFAYDSGEVIGFRPLMEQPYESALAYLLIRKLSDLGYHI